MPGRKVRSRSRTNARLETCEMSDLRLIFINYLSLVSSELEDSEAADRVDASLSKIARLINYDAS